MLQLFSCHLYRGFEINFNSFNISHAPFYQILLVLIPFRKPFLLRGIRCVCFCVLVLFV
jgi:hypothetical protein